jgi:hypothetical protein
LYTSPKEVEITRNSNLIQDAYIAAYKERYKVEPFIETEDLQVFTFLSKNFGLDRGSAIAKHYVSMQDEWFGKQAHNANTLRKNIQKVVADLGLREDKKNTSKGIVIRTSMSCDKCHTYFDFIGAAEDLARPSFARMCHTCQGVIAVGS